MKRAETLHLTKLSFLCALEDILLLKNGRSLIKTKSGLARQRKSSLKMNKKHQKKKKKAFITSNKRKDFLLSFMTTW